MIAARTWLSAALLGTSFAGCLFPDYEAGPEGGGSGGQLGASGDSGAGAVSGGTGAAGGTGGNAGTGAPGGASGMQGNAGTAGVTGSAGSGGVENDACAGDACGPRENCSDGADDDSDGKTDCFDSDCASDPACGGKCVEAAELLCDAVRPDRNSGASGATTRIAPPLYKCSTAELPGPEYAYRFTGDPDQEVFVQLYGLDGNLDVLLVDATAGAICDAERECTAAGNMYNDTRPEALGFAASAGRSYFIIVDGPASANYSLSIGCSRSGGCKPSRAIQAGQTIQANTTLGGAPNITQNVNRYSCFNNDRLGPEAAFFFTPTETGSYVVRVDNPSANVDLFVLALPNCDGTCLSPTSLSVNPARQSESVTFSAQADTSYYIVVDGPSAVDTFDLSVSKL
jgi:hypothetical protein